MFTKNLIRSPEDPPGTGGGTASPPAAAPPAAPAGPAPAPVAAAPTPDPLAGKGDWPDDWRTKLAGEDPKLLQRFGRYASPKDVAQALIAAQNKISSGELLPSLGKEPSAEALKEWRAAHGIPEKSDGYDVAELKVSEAGKATVAKFLEMAHGTNQTPEQVKANLKFINEMQKDHHKVQLEKDADSKIKCEDALHAEWGGDYRRNQNAIQGMLDGLMPAELQADFMMARLPDGRQIGAVPEVLKALLGVTLQANPVATIVPGGSGNPMKGIEDRIKDIETTMRKDSKTYYGDEKMQEEYRKLITAREDMKQRV
jgi:hypothetical protein